MREWKEVTVVSVAKMNEQRKAHSFLIIWIKTSFSQRQNLAILNKRILLNRNFSACSLTELNVFKLVAFSTALLSVPASFNFNDLILETIILNELILNTCWDGKNQTVLSEVRSQPVCRQPWCCVTSCLWLIFIQSNAGLRLRLISRRDCWDRALHPNPPPAEVKR